MSYVPLSQKLNVPALTLDRGERLSKANTPILLHGPVNLGHSKLLEFSYKFGLDLTCLSALHHHHHTKLFPSLL